MKKVLLSLGVVGLLACGSQAAVVISTLTDTGQLDLNPAAGSFVYAVDTEGIYDNSSTFGYMGYIPPAPGTYTAASESIRGVAFTNSGIAVSGQSTYTTTGITITGGYNRYFGTFDSSTGAFGSLEAFTGTDSTKLGELVGGVHDGEGGTDTTNFTLAATGLTTGDTYEVQFIMYDKFRGAAGNTQYDITVNGVDITGGLIAYPRSGTYTALVQDTFLAAASTMNVTFGGPVALNGSMLSGFTVQDVTVPEPASLSVLALGGLGLLMRRSRR